MKRINLKNLIWSAATLATAWPLVAASEPCAGVQIEKGISSYSLKLSLPHILVSVQASSTRDDTRSFTSIASFADKSAENSSFVRPLSYARQLVSINPGFPENTVAYSCDLSALPSDFATVTRYWAADDTDVLAISRSDDSSKLTVLRTQFDNAGDITEIDSACVNLSEDLGQYGWEQSEGLDILQPDFYSESFNGDLAAVSGVAPQEKISGDDGTGIFEPIEEPSAEECAVAISAVNLDPSVVPETLVFAFDTVAGQGKGSEFDPAAKKFFKQQIKQLRSALKSGNSNAIRSSLKKSKDDLRRYKAVLNPRSPARKAITSALRGLKKAQRSSLSDRIIVVRIKGLIAALRN